MGYRIAAAVGSLGIVAATALAATTPVTPPPGAFIDPPSRPVFSWTVPANEQSDGLFIANSPDTTAAAMFPEGNLVRAPSFANGETTWSSSAPLYAGHYWWLVSSHDRNTAQRLYSAPRDFRIGLSFEFDRAEVRRSLSQHWLSLTPHWKGNMRAVRVKVSLLLRGRIIWARSGLRRNHIGSRGSVSFTWHRPASIEQAASFMSERGSRCPTRLPVQATASESGLHKAPRRRSGEGLRGTLRAVAVSPEPEAEGAILVSLAGEASRSGR